MDRNCYGRWLVRLDGYHVIIEHRTRDKHQNADSFKKKTDLHEQLDKKQADEAEIQHVFFFLDKTTYATNKMAG